MIDPRHLALLRELRDRGSVAAVAAAGHRTPSAVSQQLRTAERELGARLVEPVGRGLRLTDEGLLLADQSLEVEVAIERATAALASFRQRPTGMVRLAALPSAAEYLVPQVLRDIAVEQIALVVDDVDVAAARFGELVDDYDLVLGHEMGAPGTVDPRVRAATLLREPLDVAVSTGHRLGRRRRVRALEVIGEPWICPPAGYPFRTLLAQLERETGRVAEVVQEVRDNRLVEAMVCAEVGVAFLPRLTTRPRPGVRLLELGDVDAGRQVRLMARRDRAERAVVRRVWELLERVARRTPTNPVE